MSTQGEARTLNQAFLDAVVRTMQTLDEHVNHYVAQRLAECGVSTGVEWQLSRREHEVLPLILQGLTNKEIGVRLGISERTAKFHVSGILRKSGATSRLELLRGHKAAPSPQLAAAS
jgi:DNA-binding NarL/FixJ family response regulator